MTIGDQIQKIRLKKGISQQFIADTIGISQSKFNRIENGKSDILLNDLLEICQILRINYIELLQSSYADQSVEKEEIKIPELYKEIKSLKSQLLEIKEHLYSNRGGGKYFERIFSKILNFGKGLKYHLTTYSPQ
jgi:transcriptional regulator with XRE-family HTH domain